jgi:hypothetical protein
MKNVIIFSLKIVNLNVRNIFPKVKFCYSKMIAPEIGRIDGMPT